MHIDPIWVIGLIYVNTGNVDKCVQFFLGAGSYNQRRLSNIDPYVTRVCVTEPSTYAMGQYFDYPSFCLFLN